MAVGNQVDVGGLNTSLGDCAVSLRDAARLAASLWGYITSLGADQPAQVAALAAKPGWEDAENDPQTFWTKANYAFSVAQSYYGLSGGFDYDDGLAGVRGPS